MSEQIQDIADPDSHSADTGMSATLFRIYRDALSYVGHTRLPAARQGNSTSAPSSRRWTPPPKAKPAKSSAIQEENRTREARARTMGDRIAGKLSQPQGPVS